MEAVQKACNREIDSDDMCDPPLHLLDIDPKNVISSGLKYSLEGFQLLRGCSKVLLAPKTPLELDIAHLQDGRATVGGTPVPLAVEFRRLAQQNPVVGSKSKGS